MLVSTLLLGPTPVASAGMRATRICMTGSESDAAHARGTDASLHYLTDVRAAGHPCYDRVVFEFEPGSGGGQLGYRVEYREEPLREEGRGRVVPVDGEAFLVVRLSPARDVRLRGPHPEPTYEGPDSIRPAGADHVREVRHVGSFEAAVTWAIGLDRRNPFAATVFESPRRLVIDIG